MPPDRGFLLVSVDVRINIREGTPVINHSPLHGAFFQCMTLIYDIEYIKNRLFYTDDEEYSARSALDDILDVLLDIADKIEAIE